MSTHNKGQRCDGFSDCRCPKCCLCRECLFFRRSASIFSGLQSRLKERKWKSGAREGKVRVEKRELPFDLAQFRAWLTVVLEDTPFCEYCGNAIDILTISPDHAIPMTRGGSLGLANLRGCCGPCNKMKGSLLPGEFKSLLKGLATFSEAGRNDVMKRLRGGILHFGSKKKELKPTNILAIPSPKADTLF